MPRPIQAIIHRSALQHNLQRLRRLAPAARMFAVVKANAYGHGLSRVFDALRSSDGFALLDLAEARQLRQLGWRGPILLLEGIFEPQDLNVCAELELWQVVHCEAQINWIAAHKTRTPHPVFLLMNSGMNRLGFRPEHYRAAYARLQGLTQVGAISLMTHFANADLPGGTDDAWRLFARTTRDLDGSKSVCNSAASLRHAQDISAHTDWLRCGIALYGGSPDYPEHDMAHWQLQAAMTLKADIIATQNVPAGESVGYGATFTARQAMRIGIVACGYADGYPRHAPTGTPVLVDGVRSRLLGRVSMDMLAVDLQPVPQAGAGSEVTLWGHGPQGACLPIDEVAHAAGTIGYELMCALASRVPVIVD